MLVASRLILIRLVPSTTVLGAVKLLFQDLRTNVRGKLPPPGTYTEAVYSAASPVLRGHPLAPGEDMGCFCLGSTVVLVVEAPSHFEFDIHPGQKVKVGQKLGDVPDKLKRE